eukprot:TRINITY_DN1244_c0_g1_i1.p1 TRINITY_DN1244_c0_g1~~TRINITY_DN1244_c0_g1_i1.p1  ORF type:complete len:103 (-),score=29.96 TRINITY_DN1244_c0_g1_i1:55-363(-)
MAKRKNHTAKNQTRKQHRNGIKKPKKGTQPGSHKGLDQNYRRNLKFAKRWNDVKGGRPKELRDKQQKALVEAFKKATAVKGAAPKQAAKPAAGGAKKGGAKK